MSPIPDKIIGGTEMLGLIEIKYERRKRGIGKNYIRREQWE